jgi:hypothetical protein
MKEDTTHNMAGERRQMNLVFCDEAWDEFNWQIDSYDPKEPMWEIRC